MSIVAEKEDDKMKISAVTAKIFYVDCRGITVERGGLEQFIRVDGAMYCMTG